MLISEKTVVICKVNYGTTFFSSCPFKSADSLKSLILVKHNNWKPIDT